ncbi:hypothetical protein ACFLTC_01930 [Chloroflexota bacterium]
MTLEPTPEQRHRFQSIPQGPLALVQFLAIQDQSAFVGYRQASEGVVEAEGGVRTHDVRIDQFFAGGEMSFQAITVDRLPHKESALAVLEAVSAERQEALSQVYALAVRPQDGRPKLVKALGFLSPILTRVLGTNTEKAMTGFGEIANPQTGPVPETVAEMRSHDQSTPFYMMNLNKYYAQAHYASGDDISGEEAYNRYAGRIAPYLVSVGGYPDIIGPVIGTLAGDPSSFLHDAWSEFAMVYYPCRRDFINMMSNSPKKGVHHRDAGLQRAVLMPSSDWAEGIQ